MTRTAEEKTTSDEQVVVPVPVFALIPAQDAVVIEPTPERKTTLDNNPQEPLRILFIGDVVGKPGRAALGNTLQNLKRERGIDLVIAQSENLAHGFGITPGTITELQNAGVDVFTGGNHTWKNAAGVQLLKAGTHPTVLRPANAPTKRPGATHTRITVHGFTKDLIISCLLGQVFMKDTVASPFETADALIATYADENVHTIFDLHAEATGEKRVFGYYTDGRALAVVGTHTHVQTADEQILENSTAYITDLGFTGALDSSIGMRRDIAIKKVAYKQDISLEPPDDADQKILQGTLVTIDRAREKASSIERLQLVSE